MDHQLTDAPQCPLTGAYYWVPIPPLLSLTWRVLTCQDLEFDEDQSHYDMWPKCVSYLAELWGRDPKVLRRHLVKQCYELPRGRVTKPENFTGSFTARTHQSLIGESE
jgi:hypothetical protein